MRLVFTLAISLVLHAAMAFGMVVVLPLLDSFSPPPPLMVEMVVDEPEPPPEVAEPEPEPEVTEPEPEPEITEPEPPPEPERVVERRPEPVPEPTQEPPPPSDEPPPPAEEAIADFTGETLTNDQGAAWNSAVGNGQVMEGPVGQPNAAVTGRRREGARGGAIGGTGDGEPGPRTVAVGNLSRPPGSPSDLVSILRRNYPTRARDLGLEGRAYVRLRVRSDGRVQVLSVLSEAHDGMGEACRRSIRAAGRWDPPLDRNGEPVDTIVRFFCNFTIDF
ncbi:MAG: energy transducer TonB [Myxococcota bacterium]|nr:energy transducer TonB [Myxococcota bacterium]